MGEAWLAGALLVGSVTIMLGRQWPNRARTWSGTVAQRQPGWTTGLVDFFYFVGLPYLALVLGWLPAHFLGVRGLEYFAIGQAESILAALQNGLALMLLEGLAAARKIMTPAGLSLFLWTGLLLTLGRTQLLGLTRPPGLGQIIYDGLHWAFYRALFWLLSGDLYVATVLGAGLIVAEREGAAYLAGLSEVHRDQRRLNTIILILTATLFYYSPNLWLVWIAHGLMAIIWAVIRGIGPDRESDSARTTGLYSW